jgi:hypothetical protein
MATKLRRLAITEVALVDEGDNPGAAIVIAKRREEQTEPGTSVPEPTTEIGKCKETNMEFDINAIPEEFRKGVQAAIDAAAAVATTEAIAKAKADAVPELEPIVEVPSDVQKKLDMQAVEIAKLRKELDARAESESIAKCKAEFGAFAEVEDIGKALFKLDRVDSKLAADVRKICAQAQAIAKKTKVITKQIGTSGEKPTTSAGAKLESLAKARATKDNISFFKAYDLTLDENPELYGAYLNESPTPVVVDDTDVDDSATETE